MPTCCIHFPVFPLLRSSGAITISFSFFSTAANYSPWKPGSSASSIPVAPPPPPQYSPYHLTLADSPWPLPCLTPSPSHVTLHINVTRPRLTWPRRLMFPTLDWPAAAVTPLVWCDPPLDWRLPSPPRPLWPRSFDVTPWPAVGLPLRGQSSSDLWSRTPGATE